MLMTAAKRTNANGLCITKNMVLQSNLVKLNISTDSLGKYTPDIDGYAQTRFPATAPSKESKEKKMFAALKKEAKGTPKGTKKLPEELVKKIQKSNLDILNTFKNSTTTQSKKASSPTAVLKTSLPSAMLKALKRPGTGNNIIGPGESSTPQASKNKSFRGDKLADFTKNNFFVKNNYFHPRDSKASADPGQKSTSNIKNKTTDGVLRQAGLSTSERGDKPISKMPFPTNDLADYKSSEMIAEDDAGNLNIEDMTFVEKKLNVINSIMENDFEIYDQVKEYVDIVQEESFSEFFTVLKNTKVRQVIKNSMILERWAMFFVFFFYFNKEQAATIFSHLKELVQIVHMNSLCYLRLFAQWISPFEHLEPTYKSLNNLILKRHMECHHGNDDKGDDVRKIKKNNLLIVMIFRKTMHLVDQRIQEGLGEMFTSLDQQSLKEGLESCLDSFCQFLVEKGVVSVEYTSDQGRKSHETPETDVTKGQDLVPHPHHYGKPDPPFLPATTKKYTLVMDLDETLVHYEDNGVLGQFYLRPYAQEFIDEMAKYYEVVIFTAALQDYADWIINRLDSNKNITHRLYRQHTSATNGNYHVKDISKLGRDLSKTIIVDNIPENFQLQADNGIFIKSWFKDPDDSALFELMPLLREIAQKGVADVRVALKRFRDKMIENIKRGCLQPHLNLTLE